MFYYYGRKKQIAHFYPKPKFGKIIEPFAGAAAYSLHDDHWTNEVFLIDINEPIINLWLFLKNATPADIKKMPNVKEGDRLSSFSLTQEERLLMSLHIIPGATSNRDKVGKFNRWHAGKKYIVDNLYKIKHWNIKHGSYEDSLDVRATWFLDPPYHCAGKHYVSKSVNNEQYIKWLLKRDGLIMVCEGEGHENKFPFVPLCEVNNGGMNYHKKSKEYVWIFETRKMEVTDQAKPIMRMPVKIGKIKIKLKQAI
jgi:site-specific DNA-adenine methylase